MGKAFLLARDYFFIFNVVFIGYIVSNDQASDGKALLLPDELEMIRTSLLAVNGITSDTVANIASGDIHNVEATPEELFRKYTETDSRPLTPAPTLASGPALTNRAVQDDLIITCSPQERTTLVLDLRTISRDQVIDGFC